MLMPPMRWPTQSEASRSLEFEGRVNALRASKMEPRNATRLRWTDRRVARLRCARGPGGHDHEPLLVCVCVGQLESL